MHTYTQAHQGIVPFFTTFIIIIRQELLDTGNCVLNAHVHAAFQIY